MRILFSAGYKYQLYQPYSLALPIRPDHHIVTEFIELDTDGLLTIARGYAWDGPSGPTVDTPNFMRGSLVHDALYQLMREGHLDAGLHRETADSLLRSICIEDGMSHLRAALVYQAVRKFGASCATASSERPILSAP